MLLGVVASAYSVTQIAGVMGGTLRCDKARNHRLFGVAIHIIRFAGTMDHSPELRRSLQRRGLSNLKEEQ